MRFFRTVWLLLLASVISASALAQDHGTPDEARALVNAALGHIKKVGNTQAFKDFTLDKATWVKKDLYIFVFDTQGIMLAHGANGRLIGNNLSTLKDQKGKPFVRELIDLAATQGEGWVDYEWAHPVTKKIEKKSTFTKRIPGFNGSILVGIYR